MPTRHDVGGVLTMVAHLFLTSERPSPRSTVQPVYKVPHSSCSNVLFAATPRIALQHTIKPTKCAAPRSVPSPNHAAMPEAGGEREPLIDAPAGQPGDAMGAVSPPPNDKEAEKLGPMEISRSTRYGILAGIWTATFLSVCTVSSYYCQPVCLVHVSLRVQSLNSASHFLACLRPSTMLTCVQPPWWLPVSVFWPSTTYCQAFKTGLQFQYFPPSHPSSKGHTRRIGWEPRTCQRPRPDLRRLTVADFRYLLATSTFTPLYGRLCNVMGRRNANQMAVYFAALGTIACGFSANMEYLIAARFVSLGKTWLALS